MNAPRVIQGNYADLQFVRTRSVAKISIEIPIELAASFIELFGAPNPSAEVAVAIARLEPTVVAHKAETAALAPPQSDSEPSKERRPFAELSPSVQAGMICNEPAFWKYIREKTGMIVGGKEEAANYVRTFCEVNSRSDIAIIPGAKLRWQLLASDYMAWRNVLV